MQKVSMAKVTVLMPVYNAGLFLRETIESILCQTWSDFEFLIINDGSTDSSREIILSFDDPRIRLVDNQSNIGLTKSLNRGLQLAIGEYVARQDADDISYRKRFERQVKFMSSHPEVVLLGTRARAINEKGKPQREDLLRIPVGSLAIRWYLIFQNAFIHSSVMFRRSIIWEKLGGYDESFERAQDYELWSRTARSFKVDNLADVLIDHRFEYGSTISSLPLPIPAEEEIALNNLQVFLEYPDAPAEWAHYINHLRRKDRFDQNTDWEHVAKMFDRIYKRYVQLHPEARFDQTIQAHLAYNLYWLAYYSAPHNRRVSLRAYLQARKLDSKTDRHPSLIKYAALWSMGERIRSIYRCAGKLGKQRKTNVIKPTNQ